MHKFGTRGFAPHQISLFSQVSLSDPGSFFQCLTRLSYGNTIHQTRSGFRDAGFAIRVLWYSVFVIRVSWLTGFVFKPALCTMSHNHGELVRDNPNSIKPHHHSLLFSTVYKTSHHIGYSFVADVARFSFHIWKHVFFSFQCIFFVQPQYVKLKYYLLLIVFIIADGGVTCKLRVYYFCCQSNPS